jgi:hypothetical protein
MSKKQTKNTVSVGNNSPLTENGNRLTRKFLGKISDFKDRQEEKFNQQMLKAYCKGNTHFRFSGLTHEVLQEYSYVNN